MKYLIVALVALFTWYNQSHSDEFSLKPVDIKITKIQMQEAAEIMVKRLRLINITATAAIDFDSKIIKLHSSDNLSSKWPLSLVTKRGHLKFMEESQHHEIIKNAKIGKLLYKLLDTTEHRREELGTFPISSLKKIRSELDHLNDSGVLKTGRLTYSIDKDSTGRVFLLRAAGSGKAVLREDIEEVSVMHASSDDLRIQIRLSENGGEAFANLTADNINKIVAVVLDDQVLIAPRVVESVTGGKVNITGQFSSEEAGYLCAILRGSELPCAFEVVE